MKKVYVQDPVTFKLVLREEYTGASADAPYVMSDIQPYKSMITGEMITSRSVHRDHLRQHNCTEIGNEIKAATEPKKRNYDSNAMKRMIGEIMSSKGM